jgi:hypothetical protein
MKKTPSKLRLHHETLHHLDPARLDRVAGDVQPPPTFTCPIKSFCLFCPG